MLLTGRGLSCGTLLLCGIGVTETEPVLTETLCVPLVPEPPKTDPPPPNADEVEGVNGVGVPPEA